MNDELLKLIREKCYYILNIRKIKSYVEVQIPCTYQESEISWIPLSQSTIECEKIIEKWLSMGGEIQN